jgi:hypothetical protein
MIMTVVNDTSEMMSFLDVLSQDMPGGDEESEERIQSE